MNKSVIVELASFKGKLIQVMDDQLHFLIHEGQVSYAQAVNALKEAGIELDKRFYPWLRDIENLATGELKPETGPAKPEPTAEIAEIPDTSDFKAKVEDKVSQAHNEAPAEQDAPDNSEGAH